MTNELTYEQEIVRSVFGAYINDLKVYSTKPDRPTIKKLEEVRGKAIKALEQRWIPVSERLPEYKKPLLVTYKHYEEYKVAIAHIVEDGFYVTDRETALFNVVAWMPLPEAYKPEKGGAE